MEKVVGRCRAAAVVHHRSQAAVENNFLAFDQDNLAVAVVLVDNTVEDLRWWPVALWSVDTWRWYSTRWLLIIAA
jgi:hypothetical protein